jgi:type I restriction enzyme S subunit
MSEIKYQKLDTLLKYLKKSKIKAGEGKDRGKYPFYTSSAKLTKRIDIADYEDESIILGSGGLASIHYTNQPFSTSTDCFVLTPINKTNIDLKYIYYYLKSNMRLLDNGFKGVGLKHISKKYISNIKIPIQPLENQRKISTFLTKLEELIEKRQESIKLLDELIKSTFLDMFGDPVLNTKGWDIKTLNKFGDIITGNTPPRAINEYYNDKFIEWIKTDNILEDCIYPSEAKEYLSKSGLDKGRFVTEGAILVTCIAGSLKSIGNVCLLDRKVAFNQQINAIQPNENINPYFLYFMLKISQYYIQKQAGVGMKKIITKSVFQNIKFPLPPKSLQDKFAEIVKKIEDTKKLYQNSLDELNNLFNSTAQKAFKGELDVSKIETIQPQQKEAITMLDKKQILELIAQGNFDPKDYVNEQQSYDDIRDMIIGTKNKSGLIDEGLVAQEFDKELKKMVLKVTK